MVVDAGFRNRKACFASKRDLDTSHAVACFVDAADGQHDFHASLSGSAQSTGPTAVTLPAVVLAAAEDTRRESLQCDLQPRKGETGSLPRKWCWLLQRPCTVWYVSAVKCNALHPSAIQEAPGAWTMTPGHPHFERKLANTGSIAALTMTCRLSAKEVWHRARWNARQLLCSFSDIMSSTYAAL